VSNQHGSGLLRGSEELFWLVIELVNADGAMLQTVQKDGRQQTFLNQAGSRTIAFAALDPFFDPIGQSKREAVRLRVLAREQFPLCGSFIATATAQTNRVAGSTSGERQKLLHRVWRLRSQGQYERRRWKAKRELLARYGLKAYAHLRGDFTEVVVDPEGTTGRARRETDTGSAASCSIYTYQYLVNLFRAEKKPPLGR